MEAEVLRASGRKVVVATKAFGMGVDIPNIRWVVHVSPSESLEDYVQEAGRAGRDGLPSVAAVMYNPADFRAKAGEVLAQLPRPSEVVRLHNLLSRVYRALGSPRMLVPLRALPGGRVSLRGLDFLRSAGILDYWLVQRAELYQAEPDVPVEEEAGWSIRLPGGLVFSSPGLPEVEGLRRVPFSFQTCGGELRLVAAGRVAFSTGGCGGEWELVNPGGYVIVEWAPGYRPEEVDILPADMFSALHRRRSSEIRRLEALREAVEAALAASSRGPVEADAAFKDAVRRYFSSPASPRGPGELPSPTVRECPSLKSCAEAAEVLAWLEDALGPEGVYVAYSSGRLLGELAELYRSARGRPFRFRSGSLASVARLAERGEWGRLMDLGYVVAVAERGRLAERAARALKPYPYARLYIAKI